MQILNEQLYSIFILEILHIKHLVITFCFTI